MSSTNQVIPSFSTAASPLAKTGTWGLWIVALVGLGYFLFAFLYITIARIGYPFALEWMEGTSLVPVQRILAGQPLYVQPTPAYIPMLYPPLYYFVAASFAWFMGLSLLPLRLVSLLAFLGSLLFIYLIVFRLTRHVLPGLFAAGFFAAVFYLGGSWFDVARVDMLALLLLLGSVYLSLYERFWPLLFGGLLLALACTTKQTFLPILISLSLYFLLFRRDKTVFFSLSAMLGYVSGFVFLNLLYEGWYKFFIYDIPTSHRFFEDLGAVIQSLRQYWSESMILVVPIMLVLTLSYFVLTLQPLGDYVKSNAFFLLVFTSSAFFTSWFSLLNPGSYKNVLIPGYAVAAIAAGLGLDQLLARARDQRLPLILGALCAFQFLLLIYPISAQIPTEDDLAAGRGLVEEIQSQPGDVLIPFHPELNIFAGKAPYADWIGFHELSGGFSDDETSAWRAVSAQTVSMIKNRHFSLIILDMDQFLGHPEQYYLSEQIEYQPENAFYPVTGVPFRPIIKYYLSGE